jgi:hypothetical protein
MIVKNTDRFLLIEEGRLLRKVREGVIVPYIEPLAIVWGKCTVSLDNYLIQALQVR